MKEPPTLDAQLQIVQHTGERAAPITYTSSIQDFESGIVCGLSANRLDKSLSDIPNSCTFNTIKDEDATRVVLVQAAAPFNILIVEIASKAVEVLLAGAVILGSTAGASLGFTLSSIFPRRFAAGLFVSSYGQTLNGGMGSPGNYLP